MGLLNLFKLEKLKIHVYDNRERTGAPLPGQSFEVMFNPESYSQSFENIFQEPQAVNSSGAEAKYAMSRPADLTLKLIIDGTGVSTYGITNLLGGKMDVQKKVDDFLQKTSYMDGKTHEPKFLIVSWGKLNFSCRLKSVTINYTLFDNSGIPLRAELNTVFINDIETKKRLKKENKSSPDLTHWRVVQAHDTLPLMCEEIYGSPHYYIQVAKINKLNKFRDLVPGQELFFPPITS